MRTPVCRRKPVPPCRPSNAKAPSPRAPPFSRPTECIAHQGFRGIMDKGSCRSERISCMKSLENTPSAQGVTKTQPEAFDLVMLGGGTGSTIAAWTFAGQGQRVAVIERKYIGGSCPNIACLPSKNIIHGAKVASYFRRSHEFGITHDGFAIGMADVRERKRRMVSGM